MTGIELLTGMNAGSSKEADTLYGLVDKKLRQLSIKARRYGAGASEAKAKL